MPSIEIDDDVFERLKSVAEPLVDTPNSVLRRLLGIEQGVQQSGGGRVARSTSSRVPDHAYELATKRLRVRRGVLVPQGDYEPAILRAIVELGGRASAKAVIERVGELMGDKLTEIDRAVLKSGGLRWENRAQWARHALVRRGLLDPDAPWGEWVITAAGRAELERRGE